MPYQESDVEALSNEGLESFLESTDEAWDREALPRYQPTYRGGRPLGAFTARTTPVTGLSGATIQTPAGQAQVRFGAAVATRESVETLAKELRAEIKNVADATRKVDQTLDKNTSVLDRKVGAVQGGLRRFQEQSQFTMLLPLLLAKPPEMESITIGGAEQAATAKFKKDDNMTMLLLLMAMSGGFGGSSGGDSNTMLLFALALSGGFGSKK